MQREEEVVFLHLDDIIPNRFQPREVFDERPLKELAVSIKEHGVIQPIIVRQVNDKYEIIAGERRYKASALAGLTKIPAIIRNLDDKESSKIALLENLQRKDLNPIEEAKTYQKILELDEMTQEELAKTMGKSQSSVANKLRLLSLPDEIKQALLDDKISERHARALLNVKEPNKQQELLKEIIDQKLTVRQLEEKIKGTNANDVSNVIGGVMAEPTLEKVNLDDAKPVSGQDNYVSDQPLIPSFSSTNNQEGSEPLLITSTGENLMDQNKETLNYQGQSTITTDNNDKQPLIINPTSSSETSGSTEEDSSPKFINFGEIDDNEDNSDTDNSAMNNNDSSNNDSFINNLSDINDIRDINSTINNTQNTNNDNSSGTNLDSLLQINPTNNTNASNDFKFFSSAQDMINESEKETKTEGDYFKSPDLVNINVTGDNPLPTNNVSLAQANYDLNNSNTNSSVVSIVPNNNTLQDSINIIKDAINEIKLKGIKIDSDENDLENSYQIVIKIEK